MYKHYSRRDVQEELLRISKNREIQVWNNDVCGKRPDTVNYIGDIGALLRQGMTSFHISVERWKDPLQLRSGMSKRELDELRLGFDLILDIDCKNWEYSRITAELLIDALKFHDVKDISVKFSVTGDTPVLIKTNKSISLMPISKATELYRSNKKIKVLSLDLNNKLIFSDITGTLSHKDNIYNIYHEQSQIPLKVTKHHSVFCWDKGFILQKKVFELVKGDNLVSFQSSNNLRYYNQNITNQFVFSHFNKKIRINIDKGIMRLIGYYLAEGHTANINNMVGFTFNQNEKKYIEDCKNLINNLPNFSSKISDHYPNSGSHQIIFYSKEWFSFFSSFCGTKKDKHIPNFVWKLPKDYFLELLLGYIRGDAHKRSKRYLTIKSVAHRLSYELLWLCKLHNISCNLYEEFNKPHKLPQGNLFKGSHIYMIKIPRSEISLIEFNIQRNKFSKYPSSKTFPINGLKEVYKKIKPGKFLKHRNEEMTLNKKRANIKRILKVIDWFENYHTLPIDKKSRIIINNYKDIINQDICVLPIRKIIRKKEKQMVYDLSVKDTERFFGNYYPILLHNSGNHGFHIAVPFEAFPETLKGEKINLLFPDIVRIIASYLKEMIKPFLSERLLKLDSAENLAKNIGKKKEELMKDNEFDPFSVVDIDTILISSRHMFRAPYSFNEKSGLVSIPITDIKTFKLDDAKPENVKVNIKYLDLDSVEKGSAKQLLLQAYDWNIKKESYKITDKKTYEVTTKEIPEDFFPSCIKNILKGIKTDGRKRAVFILINFLNHMNWPIEKIESYLLEWNKKNYEQLREGYIKSQILWYKKQNSKILPPNCDNPAYYRSMGIDCGNCTKVRNPVNYATRMFNLKNFKNTKNNKK